MSFDLPRAQSAVINGENAVTIFGVHDFNAYRIFDCGQSFRFDINDGVIDGVAMGKRIKITQEGDTVSIIGADLDDYENIWQKYLDLDEDYGEINKDILENFGKYNDTIERAMSASSGIRILRQDRWEALCSFIISQNNNIPRIKKIISDMSRALGEEFTSMGKKCYAFPTPEAILAAGEDKLKELKMGFRARYVTDAARRVISGETDLFKVDGMSFEEGERYLCEICGVGKKVADCTLLYGYHKTEAFPIDVWIRRVLDKYYPDGIELSRLGNYAGIAQQYLFFYERYLDGKEE